MGKDLGTKAIDFASLMIRKQPQQIRESAIEAVARWYAMQTWSSQVPGVAATEAVNAALSGTGWKVAAQGGLMQLGSALQRNIHTPEGYDSEAAMIKAQFLQRWFGAPAAALAKLIDALIVYTRVSGPGVLAADYSVKATQAYDSATTRVVS